MNSILNNKCLCNIPPPNIPPPDIPELLIALTNTINSSINNVNYENSININNREINYTEILQSNSSLIEKNNNSNIKLAIILIVILILGLSLLFIFNNYILKNIISKKNNKTKISPRQY